jgi:hypothetical protein
VVVFNRNLRAVKINKINLLLALFCLVYSKDARSESLLPSACMAPQNSGMYLLMQADSYDNFNNKGSGYVNAGDRPELLLYKHFIARKKGDLGRIAELYGHDESEQVRRKYSDIEAFPSALKPYADIEFVGKVTVGDTIRFRLNMIGADVRPFPMVQYAVYDSGEYRLTLRGENESFLSRVGRGHIVNYVTGLEAESTAMDDFLKALKTGAYRAITFSADAAVGDGAFHIELDLDKIKTPPHDVAASIVLRYENSEKLTETDRSYYESLLSKLINDSRNFSSDALEYWYSDNDQKLLKRFGDSIPALMEAVSDAFSNCESHSVTGVIRDDEYVVMIVKIQAGDGGAMQFAIPFRRKGDRLILYFRDGNESLGALLTEPRVRSAIASMR